MDPHPTRLWLPWIVKLLVSWAVAGALLIPVYLGEQQDKADAKIPWHVATYEPRGDGDHLPADDERLRRWAEQQASGKVWVTRERDDDGIEVKLTYRARSAGQSLDVPWGELGYSERRGMRSGRSSTEPYISRSIQVWILRGSLLASLGYLVFGLLAWWRRPRVAPSATVTRTLLLGSAVGALVAGCGWAATVIPGGWAIYPQTGPWWFEFLVSRTNDRLIVMTVLGMAVVPLAYELFFRQALFARARAAGRARAGAVVASAVGAAHLIHAPVMALLVFGAGLGSCWVMHRTGRLLAAVVLSLVATGVGFALLWSGRIGAPSLTEFVQQILGTPTPKISDGLPK